MKLTRSAGILLHITSLPSRYGIGDLGPEASAFADFMQRSKQTYWQLLPLNPTEAGQGHSPYSAISSRAGNTLLISPDLLAEDGWLNGDELRQYQLPNTERTDFAATQKLKDKLFDKAWSAYKKSKNESDEIVMIENLVSVLLAFFITLAFLHFIIYLFI